MIGILLSGSLEVTLNTLSFLVFRFLPDDPISEQGFPPEPGLTFNVLSGLITSLSKISTKPCWMLASTTLVGPS
jgi:hypothetical protein